MDLLKKVAMFERVATKKVSVKEVITAQKEAAKASQKARELMEEYMKAGK